jgi:hypothetical protein
MDGGRAIAIDLYEIQPQPSKVERIVFRLTYGYERSQLGLRGGRKFKNQIKPPPERMIELARKVRSCNDQTFWLGVL